jgi:hypothetical protein
MQTKHSIYLSPRLYEDGKPQFSLLDDEAALLFLLAVTIS